MNNSASWVAGNVSATDDNGRRDSMRRDVPTDRPHGPCRQVSPSSVARHGDTCNGQPGCWL